MPPRKQRKTNHARLIVGEGLTEARFLKHLKTLFHTRDSGLSVKIGQAKGGSPENIVEYCIRQTYSAAYNSAFVWMDTDCVRTDKLKRDASNNQPPLSLLGSDTCVEAFFLTLLNKPTSPKTRQNKSKLKRLTKVDTSAQIEFNTHFPQTMLEQAKGKVELLSRLIDLVSRP